MALSAIQSLPVEVLLKVFQTFLGPKTAQRGGVDDLQRRRRPVLLTHVCRDWRTKALSDPFLWTDIQIHGESELFLSFFERSHPLPVDVTIRASGRRTFAPTADVVHNKFISLGEEVCDRIQSLWILNVADVYIARILSPLDGMGLSQLTSLNLRRQVLSDNDHASHTAFLTHAKSISSIALANFCFSCAPNQKALTKLELLILPPGFDAVVFGRIVESSPALETLVLGDTSIVVENNNPAQGISPTINAPSLKNLVVTPQAVCSGVPWDVDVAQPCSAQCQCTLRNLVADNLEYLEISGRSSGSEIAHLLPYINRRTKTKDLPPLRLMLNGIEKLEYAWQLPRNLYLHIAPSSFEAPYAYRFTQEFLGGVLSFQLLQRTAIDTFEATGKYRRSRKNNLALSFSNSKEEPIEPILDLLHIQSLIEDDGGYEIYWHDAAYADAAIWGTLAQTFTRLGLGAFSDSDSDEIHIHPYGWREEDEDVEDEYEDDSQDHWLCWERYHEEDDISEVYGEDPILFGEPSGLNDEHGSLGDLAHTEAGWDDEGVLEDYGQPDAVYDEGLGYALDYGSHVQTGVIYHDEIEDALGTGVLTHEGELDYDYDPEPSENPWTDGAVHFEGGHDEEDMVHHYSEDVIGEDVYGGEYVAEDEYSLNEDDEQAVEVQDEYYLYEEGAALEYEAFEDDHGTASDHGSEAAVGGGGYDSPGISYAQSDGFYDSPDDLGYGDDDDYGGYSDGGDLFYDSDVF